MSTQILTTILFIFLAVLVAANIGLLIGALACFQRPKLILAD